MAEIAQDSGGGRKKGGKVRSKKMSTRIDFTPMVDLGFLLITFFMLTTTLAKPNIMSLIMPEKKDLDIKDLEPVKESKVLTLLLGGNDKVYWYEGITDPKLDSADYSAEGLRKVILDKMDKVKSQFGEEEYEDFKTKEKKKGSYLTILIKPTENAVYKNLVDALDEMAITKTRYYVILDASEAEMAFLKNPAAGLKFNAEQQASALK
jgi:biopolymer transport protein ExbD